MTLVEKAHRLDSITEHTLPLRVEECAPMVEVHSAVALICLQYHAKFQEFERVMFCFCLQSRSLFWIYRSSSMCVTSS
jgi:hypothetical protein